MRQSIVSVWSFRFGTLASLLISLTSPMIAIGEPVEFLDMYGRTITGRDVRLDPPTTDISDSVIRRGYVSTFFEKYVAYSAGDNDTSVGIGDFDNDGLGDVAIGDGAYGDGLRVFLQNELGTLNPPVLYPSGHRLDSLAIGDLNKDGRDDVAAVNFTDDTVRVFYQNTEGTLDPEVIHDVGERPDALAVADITGDGLVDVAISHHGEAFIGVLPQQIDGTLGSMLDYTSIDAGYDDIDTGDVNGDGLTDVVKMNGDNPYNPSFSVYLQNLDGSLAAPLHFYNPSSDELPGGIAVGDVTGDGLDDIVLAYGRNKPTSGIAVFAQDQDGGISFAASYSAYDNPEPVEIADVNFDGRKDVLVLHGGYAAMSVFLQNSDGTFPSYYSLYQILYSSHYGPQGFDIGDINGDLLPDVVIADSLSGLVVLLHKPTSLYYVDTQGECGGKLPCFTSIQDALSRASDGITIRVAAGQYDEIVLHGADAILEIAWDPEFVAPNPTSPVVLSGPQW